MALAKVVDGKKRTRWITLARKKGWKAVKLELDEGNGDAQDREDGDEADAKPEPASALAAATQDVLARVNAFKTDSTQWTKALPAKITKAKVRCLVRKQAKAVGVFR